VGSAIKGVREMSDLLDRTQREIAARLRELQPAVGEFERLQAAVVALDGLGGSMAGASSPRRAGGAGRRRRPGRPRGSRSATTKVADSAVAALAVESAPDGKRRRGGTRRSTGGSRAVQAVSVITEHPGITIPELAKRMGINRTGLYRILPGPELEGKISRRELGWYPAEV
jgi:hypothetical protein